MASDTPFGSYEQVRGYDKERVIKEAAEHGCQLDPGDIDGSGGICYIEGAPWWEWLDAMYVME